MGIRYDSLDADVRINMISEIDMDVSAGTIYISPRLTEDGKKVWAKTLREACQQHDDNWLAAALMLNSMLRTKEPRHGKNGIKMVDVPINAADTLAEGEFNRYYVRGLCKFIISRGEVDVEIYRGKYVENPRPASQALIGRHLQAEKLLDDLRKSNGVEPAMGLPPGPNSGLTVKRCI